MVLRRPLTSALRLAARLSPLPRLTQTLGPLVAPAVQGPVEVTLVLAQVDTELLVVHLLVGMERLAQRAAPVLMVVLARLDQLVDKAGLVPERNSNPVISRNPVTRTKAEAVNTLEVRVDKARVDKSRVDKTRAVKADLAAKDQDRNRALKVDPSVVQELQAINTK